MTDGAQDARIDEWLRRRGAGAGLVGVGLDGLVGRWEAIVGEVADGYGGVWEDYVNDLDLRQIIDDLLRDLPDTRGPLLRRLRDADEVLRDASRPSDACLWGPDTAARRGWSRRRSWWYYAVPRRAGSDLVGDLAGRGIEPLPQQLAESA